MISSGERPSSIFSSSIFEALEVFSARDKRLDDPDFRPDDPG